MEAAPELAAAQGQGARGLWLSEERQAGGPADSAPRFGTNALPVSVGAQRVRPGACAGRGAGSREDSPPLRPPEAQGPIGALFNTTLFQYKQSRKKSRPFGGRVLGTVVGGARGAQPPSQVGGPGCQRQGQVAPRMVRSVARGRDLPLRRCCELSVGVLPRVPRPGQCKGKPLRPTHPLLPQPALRSRHPGRSPGQSRPTTATKQGKKGQSLRGTAVHHGWHGRTRTHPGGGVLRAIAAERVSETGEVGPLVRSK